MSQDTNCSIRLPIDARQLDKSDVLPETRSLEVTDSESIKFRQNFNCWTLFSTSFGLTASWLGASSTFGAGIRSGGPVLIVYGLIIGFVFNLAVAITLGELISAFTNSAGQYYWVLRLSPLRLKKGLAFVTACLSYFGCLFTTASVVSSLANSVLAVYALNNSNFVLKRWHVFVTYEILNAFVFIFNVWGRALPLITGSALYISLFAFLVTMITCLACSSGSFNLARFVFNSFSNVTGWESSGTAFIVGLINPLWSFVGIDGATHMVDELGVKQSKVFIPRTIVGTVVLGFLTAFCYSISMFFCITDADEVVKAPLPVLTIFYQSTKSISVAIFLQSLCVLTGLFCNVSSHTWQARVCWTLANEKVLPGSKYLSEVHSGLRLPINAHLFSTSLVAVIGCIYMGSTTSFNAIITASICLLLMSYAIPTVLLLQKGRLNICHGPFWMGPVGFVSNIMTLIWTIFCLVFLSFPYVKPVTPSNMNYVSAAYGVVFIYIIISYALWGNKSFSKHT